MKSVNEFLDEAVEAYDLPPLTADKRRELRYKLGMADIKDTVAPHETAMALDVVLGGAKGGSGSVRTASASQGITAHRGCPRCGHLMSGAKLANSEAAMFCTSCNVTIPV